MGKWAKFAVAGVLIVGAGVLALVLTGVWPGPSAADRERARVLSTEANTQLQQGDQESALRALNESIRLDPQDAALRARAQLYVARRDFDDALRDMDRLIGRADALSVDYSLRCWLRARGEALRDARTDCDHAIRVNPTLASAFGNRGLVSMRQRRWHEAWGDFNTALRVGGSDEWVAWRLFGRGAAAWEQGRTAEGRQDIELAMHGNPAVAAQFAEFGVGGEIVREFDDATYAAAVEPRSLINLRQYLSVYPNGAHASEARGQIAEIYAWMAETEASGRQAIPGFSFAQARGTGPDTDSFGAIAISRSTWRVAFVTDYATDTEAERSAANVCNTSSVHDCDAYAFRNVCAALALSVRDRTRGMAWAHGQDDAVHTALSACRERGGRSCVLVHSQCTPTPPAEAATSH